MPSRTQQQAGYTLIELSMVLVIIGLLVAGLLKGSELITQAKLRNTASAFDNLIMAIQTYQERYRTLPGDDNLAQGRWPSTASNGNGDRLICGAYHGGSGGTACGGTLTESLQAWQHLRSAGLLPGTGSTSPETAAGGIFGVQYSGLGMSRHLLCANHLPATIAGSIDRQLDDGLANDGAIRGSVESGTADIPASTPSSSAYVEEGNPLYVLCRSF